MEMSVFAMSLARLYKAKKITDAKVEELLAAQKITAEEAEFITKDVYDFTEGRQSADCQCRGTHYAAVEAGRQSPFSGRACL